MIICRTNDPMEMVIIVIPVLFIFILDVFILTIRRTNNPVEMSS